MLCFSDGEHKAIPMQGLNTALERFQPQVLMLPAKFRFRPRGRFLRNSQDWNAYEIAATTEERQLFGE